MISTATKISTSVGALPFTEEQRKAIDARNVSVALSAGAGCGKTFVLTERFLAELELAAANGIKTLRRQPAELHELIAITFTDRAAREMRDRIRKKCYERLGAATTVPEAEHWLGLLRSLDAARVNTIHAFCGSLLRAHAVEAELDPRFAVVEQSQADTLLAELCEDVLREKLSDSADPLHASLINLIAKLGMNQLQSMATALVITRQAAEFEPWLTRTPQEVVAQWEAFRRDTALPAVLQELVQSPASKTILEVIAQLGSSVTGELQKRCATLSQLLPSLPASRNPADDLRLIIEHARVQGTGVKKNWPDELLYEQFKTAAEKLRKAASAAQAYLQIDTAAAQDDAEAGLQLLRLAHSVQTRYTQRKRELAWVDYQDLLVHAHRLLTDPAHQALQQQLASQTRLLLVDECQDTDPLQVELIKALCGPHAHDGKLFFVGDYKQSIYRFRGADPGVFRRLQAETPTAGQLPLTTNFRSQPAILHFVNALFCEALSTADVQPLTGQQTANAAAALQYRPLHAQWPQTTAEPAIEFLWAKTEAEKKSAAGTTDEARKLEAEYIARRIRSMIDGQEPLVAETPLDGPRRPRPVEYGDIAILFRALSDVQFYEEALRRHGIPYYLVGGHAFYAQQEIYDIVNLLRTLASPADTVSLAGVLRSPMFALTDEMLFWLAQHPQGLSAGLFAKNLPSELDETQRGRVQFATATLGHLRNRKDRVPIAALLNEALTLTGYDAVLLAEFMGQRKLANVRKLVEQARTFDRSGVLGLADFIVQLSQFVAELPHEPLAATHPEKTNVVRLMTIHQSKGLEFPVVFVPDVNRQANKSRDGVMWHPQLGPLVKLKRRGEPSGVTGFDLLKVQNDAEDQAELIRLLYVATTRAADYLVLSSGLSEKELESPKGPWAKLLAERFHLETGVFRATLPSGGEYQIPQVKVTSKLPSAVAAVVQQPPAVNGSAQQISDQLARPVAMDATAQRRFSVSRFSGALQSAEEEFALQTYLTDEAGNPAAPVGAGMELGTLVHQALARIDFGKLTSAAQSSPEKLRELIQCCLESAAGYQADLAESAAELIEQFAHSQLARELAAAKVLRRELEFLLAWPPQTNAAEADQSHSLTASRYLQGFIDCLYQDAAGHWHLLDYKTNQVSADGAKTLAVQFELQLGVYALAVERIMQQPPVELIVPFLRPAVDHHFEWNAAMRQRTISRVNQEIEKTVINQSVFPAFAIA